MKLCIAFSGMTQNKLKEIKNGYSGYQQNFSTV